MIKRIGDIILFILGIAITLAVAWLMLGVAMEGHPIPFIPVSFGG